MTIDQLNVYLKLVCRRIAAKAFNRGELQPPPSCEECREPQPLQMHHDDYAEPLRVRWLCIHCHRHITVRRFIDAFGANLCVERVDKLILMLRNHRARDSRRAREALACLEVTRLALSRASASANLITLDRLSQLYTCIEFRENRAPVIHCFDKLITTATGFKSIRKKEGSGRICVCGRTCPEGLDRCKACSSAYSEQFKFGAREPANRRFP